MLLFTFLAIIDATFGLQLIAWTLHTSPKTWNEASLVCEASGGQLATPTTVTELQVFYHFMQKPSWAEHLGTSISIGLYCNDTTGSSLMWRDCGSTSFQELMAVKSGNGSCVSVLIAEKSVTAGACFGTERPFICQNVIGKTCESQRYSDMEPNMTSTSSFLTGSEAECRNRCEERQDCWAYALQQPASSLINSFGCSLYHPECPTHFEDGANLISSRIKVTGVKTCFQHFVNTSTSPLSIHGVYEPIGHTCTTSTTTEAIAYTVHMTNFSWVDAARMCKAENQQLAVIDTREKYLVTRTLFEEMDKNKDFWVGYREVITTMGTAAQWLTGADVTDVISEQPEMDTPTCGAMFMGTGENQLFDCNTYFPFVCEGVKGPCVYAVTEGIRGTSGHITVGLMEMDECKAQCDKRRQDGCFAFSYYQPSNASRGECHLHLLNTWTDAFAVEIFHTEVDRGWILARWTCILVIKHDSVSEVTSPARSSLILANSTSASSVSVEQMFPTSSTERSVIDNGGLTTDATSEDTQATQNTYTTSSEGIYRGTGDKQATYITNITSSEVLIRDTEDTQATYSSYVTPTEIYPLDSSSTDTSRQQFFSWPSNAIFDDPPLTDSSQKTEELPSLTSASSPSIPEMTSRQQFFSWPSNAIIDDPPLTDSSQKTEELPSLTSASSPSIPEMASSLLPSISEIMSLSPPSYSTTSLPPPLYFTSDISSLLLPSETTASAFSPPSTLATSFGVSDKEIDTREMNIAANQISATFVNGSAYKASASDSFIISTTSGIAPTTATIISEITVDSSSSSSTITTTSAAISDASDNAVTADSNNTTIASTTVKTTPRSDRAYKIYSNSLCRCPCPSNAKKINPETATSTEEIVEELIIPRADTMKSKRKKESTEDRRPSAALLGTFACILLGALFLFLVVADAVKVC